MPAALMVIERDWSASVMVTRVRPCEAFSSWVDEHLPDAFFRVSDGPWSDEMRHCDGGVDDLLLCGLSEADRLHILMAWDF